MTLHRSFIMSTPTVEYTTGKRGKDNVIVDGQLYTFNRPCSRIPGGWIRPQEVLSADWRSSLHPFIPPEDYAWQTLRPTLPAHMDSFTRYFESIWMGTPNRPAVFDPLTWNQYDCCLASLPRSSNLAEWWHDGFRSLVQCTNPTIWNFLTALKLEQGLTDQKITDRHMRRPPLQSC